jgi:Na+-driven multidrug efflux pump
VVRNSPSTVPEDAEAADVNEDPFAYDSEMFGLRITPLDKKLLALWLPTAGHFVVRPLVSSAETCVVGHMGTASALAAYGAASSAFVACRDVVSFLPSVVSPLVAKEYGKGGKEAAVEPIREAFLIACIVGTIASALVVAMPGTIMRFVLPPGSASMAEAIPFLCIKGFMFLPMLIYYVGYSSIKGMLDLWTPVKLGILFQLLGMVFYPSFVFRPLNLGLAGIAWATVAAEIAAAITYIVIFKRRDIITDVRQVCKWPSVKGFIPLAVGGAGMLTREMVINYAFVRATRAVSAVDATGAAAAAHTVAIQVWQLGYVMLSAASSTAALVVPNVVGRYGQSWEARKATNRLLAWGMLFGVVLTTLQLAAVPIVNVFTSVPEVRQLARTPATIGACLQLMNGVGMIAEGVMRGHQAFGALAVVSTVASAAMVLTLGRTGTTLVGVWMAFTVFTTVRVTGALAHHQFFGPLSRRSLRANLNPAAARLVHDVETPTSKSTA